MLYITHFVRSLYSQVLALEHKQNLSQAITRERKSIVDTLNLASHRHEKNLNGLFGPNHHARFFCRQFKIYRGTRGKWGNRGIVNDYKWRYPKAG